MIAVMTCKIDVISGAVPETIFYHKQLGIPQHLPFSQLL